MSQPNSSVRCHYDILEIARDADESAIKKSYRKLALKHHPDKNVGSEEAVKAFRRVQEAYECLSDPVERRWYDEHREAILRGGAGVEDSNSSSFGGDVYIFDVTPYHFCGCYDGYGDNEGGFFQVYGHVFSEILKGEKRGWINEGNIDENSMPNVHLPCDFGLRSSSWSQVSAFYNAWENFSSCLGFAWADIYELQSAESRWERRRIDEENIKARKVAKRKRNDEIMGFVAFVKKRDPRVRAAREKALEEKTTRENERKVAAEQRKAEVAAAKESWALEREKMFEQFEIDDKNAGRIRLADLDDSSDDGYNQQDRKSGKKKNRRKGKKSSKECDAKKEPDGDTIEGGISNVTTNDGDEKVTESVHNTVLAPSALVESVIDAPVISDGENIDVWRCDYCRKDFKSDKQLQNHVQSKKHKETVKKTEAKFKKQVQDDDILHDLVDELTL